MPLPAPQVDSNSATHAQELRAVRAILDSLSADIRKVASERRELLESIGPAAEASATNLLHYLALRQHDLRALQPRLSALGLSSLGRSEDQVLASIDAMRSALFSLENADDSQPRDVTTLNRQESLALHTRTLLGPEPDNRRVRIMVTAPTEAAQDYGLVHELVRTGMDCMRVNCAHDDAQAWSRMIAHLRRASDALGRPCRVAMDLGGPKIRTGPLEPGAEVIKVRPKRDELGRVTAPARIWLAADPGRHPPPSPADATLPLPAVWLRRLRAGHTLKFVDARGAARQLRVVDAGVDGIWAELSDTSYFVPGTKLQRIGARGKTSAAVVGRLPSRENPIVLRAGDTLVVHRSLRPSHPATYDALGRVLTPASIGCTLPEVFADVRSGERIWFDDGKIGGMIEAVEPDRAIVRIDRVRASGAKLRGDRGINLPDSALKLPALTAQDIKDLEFVVRHADMVSLSFAGSAADVQHLQQHLQRLGGDKLGLILKIETRRGFENLPAMLFAALRSASCGVMIARGDLAVECGFERLAEVQEEILWVCEAAHVPVIWATQVLESLAKEGFPSRAEITDAATSERAECVMLNKGPHICQAVAVLDDILQRMQEHMTKKRSMMRELNIARRFLGMDRTAVGAAAQAA
jgi:pyruvate kinase